MQMYGKFNAAKAKFIEGLAWGVSCFNWMVIDMYNNGVLIFLISFLMQENFINPLLESNAVA